MRSKCVYRDTWLKLQRVKQNCASLTDVQSTGRFSGIVVNYRSAHTYTYNTIYSLQVKLLQGWAGSTHRMQLSRAHVQPPLKARHRSPDLALQHQIASLVSLQSRTWRRSTMFSALPAHVAASAVAAQRFSLRAVQQSYRRLCVRMNATPEASEGGATGEFGPCTFWRLFRAHIIPVPFPPLAARIHAHCAHAH